MGAVYGNRDFEAPRVVVAGDCGGSWGGGEHGAQVSGRGWQAPVWAARDASLEA